MTFDYRLLHMKTPVLADQQKLSHQFYVDPRYHQDYLLRAMTYRSEWHDSSESVQSTSLEDDKLTVGLLGVFKLNNIKFSPVGWGGRIHWLRLCRQVRPPTYNECSSYDPKQSDSEASALELWGNMEYPFIAIGSKSTLIWSDRTW